MPRARIAGVAAGHPAKRATCTAAAALAAPGAAITFCAAAITAIVSTALVPVARTAAATAHATSAAWAYSRADSGGVNPQLAGEVGLDLPRPGQR